MRQVRVTSYEFSGSQAEAIVSYPAHLLAETYDPITLTACGTFGTQGDAAKAQELYAKAFAGGVQEAGD